MTVTEVLERKEVVFRLEGEEPEEGREVVCAAGISAGEALKALGIGVPDDPRTAGEEDIVGARIGGRLVDLQTSLWEGGTIVPVRGTDPDALFLTRHTAAHVMAQAVKELFPEALLAIGPVIEDGFYYDIDVSRPFQPEDLDRIEKIMKRIVKEKHPVRRRRLDREEALGFFRDDRYKQELIRDLPEDAEITTYTQDTFTDLCRGPHAPHTGFIKAFKLLKVAGAYWRGDEKRQMLQRIYGTAWHSREELKAYLTRLEEAKKRDHRVLGRKLDLFSVVEEIGPGLILWHPRGALVRRILEDYWREAHDRGGYQIVYSPHVGRSTLWKTSGHLDFYKENMYPEMQLENQSYFVKPMNCPFHNHIYKARTRSYRDLPLRYAELGTVYRFERSGVLHGLLRVRGFTQDDAHIYCTEEQVKEEIRTVIRFSLEVLRRCGFEEFASYIATRPDEKYVGRPEEWELAEEALKEAATAEGLEFEVDEGGGAFYGPKIDLKIKDALGRAWQCSTIQFDFNLPERFGLEYIAEDGKPRRPYMIHRALLGSMERFFGCLVEHFAGAFPLWLAPEQVRVLTVTEKTVDYGREVARILREKGIRVGEDFGSDKIGKKIRNAETMKVPFMLILGERDREKSEVSVRKHGEGDLGAQTLEDFCRSFLAEV